MGRKDKKSEKRRNLRLLVFPLLFIILNEICNAEAPINYKMEYYIEKANDENILHLKFIMHGMSFSKINIELNDALQFLKLKQKVQYIQNSKTILELQYNILKVGKIKLKNIVLIIDGTKLKQDDIFLDIDEPPLKSPSQFRIRIFEYENNLSEHIKDEPLILGAKYLLVLEGLFKKEKDDKITITPFFETNILKEQNTKNLNHLSTNNWHVEFSCVFYPLNTGYKNLARFEIILEHHRDKKQFIVETGSVKIIKNEKSRLELNEWQKQLEKMLSL